MLRLASEWMSECQIHPTNGSVCPFLSPAPMFGSSLSGLSVLFTSPLTAFVFSHPFFSTSVKDWSDICWLPGFEMTRTLPEKAERVTRRVKLIPTLLTLLILGLCRSELLKIKNKKEIHEKSSVLCGCERKRVVLRDFGSGAAVWNSNVQLSQEDLSEKQKFCQLDLSAILLFLFQF